MRCVVSKGPYIPKQRDVCQSTGQFLRYVRREHPNAHRLPCHRKDCSVAGAAAYAPGLSDTKKKVQAGLLRQTGARDIVAQIKRDLIQAFMVAHDLPTVQAAELTMLVRTRCKYV
jgi:hypothetical protein